MLDDNTREIDFLTHEKEESQEKDLGGHPPAGEEEPKIPNIHSTSKRNKHERHKC